MEFSEEQMAAFRLQPPPSNPSELETEMEAWWQIRMLRKKCAGPPAAPPNTPAMDTEAAGSSSTGPGPSTPSSIMDSGAGDPARTRPKPPPGIPVPPSNQFIPTSDWTKLPDRRAHAPATSTRYQMPLDKLDIELDHPSVVETPLMRFETEEAVDGLLCQYPDLTGGSAHDVEMMEPATTQPPGRSPGQFEPEISKTSGYRYNLMETESDCGTEVPSSPITPEDNELLDMVPSPVPDSRVVGTGRPKSTTPQKKKLGGPDDPSGTPN